MLLREVEYARPSSLDEAVALLAAHDGARALAGGQTLINVMKARAASPEVLVDLADLEELRSIRVTPGGALEVGAMVTYSQIALSADVVAARPVVAEVAATIADVQVRNRGTLGGNVCSNDPTNHFPPLMAAAGARFHIVGPQGERTVGSDEFFLGVYMTAVGPGELLTRITIPAGTRDGFSAVTIGKDGTCIVSAAVALDGEAGPRIAIGCVDAVPVVVRSADEVHDAVASPPSDVHASSEYRRHLAGVCVRRALQQAEGRTHA
jgi:carbon-monoxide dehydrogenase medium subunit